MIALLVLVACSTTTSSPGGPVAIVVQTPSGGATSSAVPASPDAVTTAVGKYHLTWSTTPATIPFNELFSIRTAVSDASGAPVTNATVTVDASMPQHGHGMATHPITDPGTCSAPTDGTAPVCVHPDGVYVTDGMKFHMAGEWVIHFEIRGPNGTDSADVHDTL